MTPSGASRGPASASLLAIFAMAAWGSAYVPSAWLVESWPPLLAAAARIGIGGLILLVGLMALGRPVMPGAEWGVILVLALTQSVIFYGATFIGIAEEGAGTAAVLANTDPLFVAALAVAADPAKEAAPVAPAPATPAPKPFFDPNAPAPTVDPTLPTPEPSIPEPEKKKKPVVPERKKKEKKK